jgi:hypothetical protein
VGILNKYDEPRCVLGIVYMTEEPSFMNVLKPNEWTLTSPDSLTIWYCSILKLVSIDTSVRQRILRYQSIYGIHRYTCDTDNTKILEHTI